MESIRDLMTTELVTVRKADRVGEVRDLMLDSGIHCVPVLDDDGHAVGVVTSYDLVEDVAPNESIQRVMTDHVVAIGADETLSEAAALMMTNWIHHLVVLDGNGRIEGLLSTFDLLGLVAEERVG